MLLKRTRFVAQVIGFACIGLLAFYGTAVALSGRPVPWRAPSAATSAITPGYVSYQGTLRDDSDDPANGTYNMEVRICNNSGCTGDALWCEKHNGVTVREGQFNLLLGDGDGACAGSPAPPHGPISADIFTQPDSWVELKVGGTVMTPRQRLAAVPYAMAATYATTLSAPDGNPANAVTVNNAGDVHIGDGSASADVEIPMGGMCIDSDGACASPDDGGLRVGDGGIHGTNSSDNDVYLVPSDGKVGVGTTDPQSRLDVDGAASVSGKLGVGTTSPGAKLSVIGDVRGANEGAEDNYTEIGHGGGNGYINTVGDGDLKFRHDGDNKMSLSESGDLNVSGNVTIGGSKPIFIRKATCTGHDYYCNTWWNGIEVDEWACGIVGVSVKADQDENYGMADPLYKAIALPADVDGDGKDEWKFQFDVQDETDKNQDWTFTILCVSRALADIEGF